MSRYLSFIFNGVSGLGIRGLWCLGVLDFEGLQVLGFWNENFEFLGSGLVGFLVSGFRV